MELNDGTQGNTTLFDSSVAPCVSRWKARAIEAERTKVTIQDVIAAEDHGHSMSITLKENSTPVSSL